MSDFISPGASLEIGIFQIGEGTGGKERMTDVLDGALDSPFLITASGSARSRSKVVMRAQFKQPGMKVDRIAMPLQDHRPHVVVDHGPGRGSPIREGIDVPTHQVLQALVEKEFEIERPAV